MGIDQSQRILMERFTFRKGTRRLVGCTGPFFRPSLALSNIRGSVISTSHCCRSCQHCTIAAGGKGWCRLRCLEVHPELADLAVCHHWTARLPRLPGLHTTAMADGGQQLELDRGLHS